MTERELAIEHRLTTLETALTSGFERLSEGLDRVGQDVAALRDYVKMQNGRIADLEQWRLDVERRQTYRQGLEAGMRLLTARFASIVAGAAVAGGGLATLITQALGWVR